MNFNPALLRCVLLSMIATAGVPVGAAAQWQQTEFAITTWLDPPITAAPEALPTNVRTYRIAKDAYVSRLSGWPSFFPAPANGATHRDVQRVRFAAAHAAGIQVMVADTAIATGRTLAPQTCEGALPFTPQRADSVLAFYTEPELSPLERSAHGGYFLGDEPHDNSCWVLRQRQWTRAIHERDPGQPVWINLLPHSFINLRQQWLGPSPAGDGSVPDVFSIAQYPYVNGQLVLPDSDQNGWPDHDGRRFLENMAITRETLDSTHVFWHFVDVWNLEHDENTGYDFDDPTPAHLRLYAFSPVAHGVTGIVFFGYSHAFLEDEHPDNFDVGMYCSGGVTIPCSEAAVSRGFIPTRKYRTVREIGHYLHDVVGPVVMNTSWRGTWHRDRHAENGDTWYVPSRRLAGQNSPIVKSLSDDRSMVGVFQGKGAESNTWYLMVVNKDPAFASITTTIQLHPALGLEVGAAPSAIGYAGGTTYSRVELNGNAFTVALEGGEGRLFRLTPAGTEEFLALLSPAGGETWYANQSQTVTWDDPAATVNVRLFTDVTEDDAELRGPYAELATQVTGGEVTVTVPPVTSNRARIEISATGGEVRRASHRVPIRVRAIPDSPGPSIAAVAGADGFLQSDLHLTGPNAATVLSFGDAARRLNHSTFDGAGWTTSTLADNSCYDLSGGPRCNSKPSGSYGYSPSFAFTPAGVGHAAFYTFFKSPLLGFSSQWGSTFAIHHGVQASASAPWVFRRAFEVGSVDGDCAMALDSRGVPHIVFNGGFQSSYELRVIRKPDSEWVEWSGPAYPGNPQHVRARFDASDRLWITYVTSDPPALFVLLQDDSRKAPSLVLRGAYQYPSLAVDSAGVVHLAYAVSGAQPGSATLHYRRHDGTRWSAEATVDGSVGSIGDAAIALSAASPRIVYTRNGVLVAAEATAGSWKLRVLDPTSDAEGGLSAKVSAAGVLWASYRNRANDRLMVASSTTPSGCTTCDAAARPTPLVRTLRLRAPNPMTASRAMRFELELGRRALLRVRLFDVGGRVAAEFQEAREPNGPEEVRWNVSRVPPGVYFVEARLDGEVLIRRKLVILK